MNCKNCNCNYCQKARSKVIEIARKYLGIPYKYGAGIVEAPKFFDCSSFVQYVFKEFGISLPRSSNLQAEKGEIITKLKQALPGDLIFFKGKNPREISIDKKQFKINHVGIYLGQKRMIHCTGKRNKGVSIKKIDKKIVLIKRIID